MVQKKYQKELVMLYLKQQGLRESNRGKND